MALLNKDLTDEEVDVWIRERPQDLAVTDPKLSEHYEEAIKAEGQTALVDESPAF